MVISSYFAMRFGYPVWSTMNDHKKTVKKQEDILSRLKKQMQ